MRRLRYKAGRLMMAAILLLAFRTIAAGQATRARTVRTGDPQITPVSGESWLNHVQRTFDETSMGKTGHLGPPPGEQERQLSPGHTGLSPVFRTQTTTLQGSDLYRLNCQGCHGESGLGAPPEINSVINPVRATSVALVVERMKNTGIDISRSEAAELARQSRNALLQRLHEGGQNMPPFPHLSEAEIGSIIAYLGQLAGVSSAEQKQLAIKESPVRVGEHIVKSTCHICHDATGPNPDPQQLLGGAIPPLAALTTRVSQLDLVRKVTLGAPIVMGTPPLPYRGRMPVFFYLSAEEAADVYLYLTLYPPSDSATADDAVALSEHKETGVGGPASTGGPSLAFAPAQRLPVNVSEATQGEDLRTIALLIALGLFVAALLAAGLGFTLREFKRLAASAQGVEAANLNLRMKPDVVSSLGAVNQGAHSGILSKR